MSKNRCRKGCRGDRIFHKEIDGKSGKGRYHTGSQRGSALWLQQPCAKGLLALESYWFYYASKDYQKGHTEDACSLARELGITWEVIDLTPYLKQFGIYKLFPLSKTSIPRDMKETVAQKAYHSFFIGYRTAPFSGSLRGFKYEDGVYPQRVMIVAELPSILIYSPLQ